MSFSLTLNSKQKISNPTRRFVASSIHVLRLKMFRSADPTWAAFHFHTKQTVPTDLCVVLEVERLDARVLVQEPRHQHAVPVLTQILQAQENLVLSAQNLQHTTQTQENLVLSAQNLQHTTQTKENCNTQLRLRKTSSSPKEPATHNTGSGKPCRWFCCLPDGSFT